MRLRENILQNVKLSNVYKTQSLRSKKKNLLHFNCDMPHSSR